MKYAHTSAFIRIKQLKDHLHKQKYERGSLFTILSAAEKVAKKKPNKQLHNTKLLASENTSTKHYRCS